MKPFRRALPLALAVLFSSLACKFFLPEPASPKPPPTFAAVPAPASIATLPAGSATQPALAESNSWNDQELLVALFERVNPGVVAIRVLTDIGDGLGSGIVIDAEGHIVTNYHVIEGLTDLEVDFPSGFKAHGQVIGTDLDSDLAVIAVKAPVEELYPLPLADSDLVKVGQTVVAIGNPFGLSSSMTVGIVSATGRTLQSLRTTSTGNYFTAAGIIQTDAAINPGNSGGPLINLNGEVIGINRAIRTANYNTDGEPTNTGIGFAISSNIVRRVVPGLIRDGKYDYPYLGVTSLPEITLIQQEILGLEQSAGAYVTGVVSDGPAAQAGLRAGTRATSVEGLYAGGDLIVAVDGQAVRIFNDMLGYLILHKSPGDPITLTVLRDGKEVEIPLILGKRP
ncbi:MAG: S1C family serine protease [Chloroflexota bacterium]